MKVVKKIKTVSQIAFKDISKYNEDEFYQFGRDNFIVTSRHLNNKTNRRLNKLLGLHNINYFKNQ